MLISSSPKIFDLHPPLVVSSFEREKLTFGSSENFQILPPLVKREKNYFQPGKNQCPPHPQDFLPPPMHEARIDSGTHNNY